VATPKSKFAAFPLGHFDPQSLAQMFPQECALIGGLVIAWGQFDRQLCNLFSRLLGFPYMKPPDKRAEAVFYSSANAKARRDAMVSLIKLIDDKLCRDWLAFAVEKASEAADKRNNIIHSEYFADLSNPLDSHLMQSKPAAKNPEIKRPKIRQQIIDAITALGRAQYYMEFAFAATRGRESLEPMLKLYEQALHERREEQHPHSKPQDSR
jgi:hypothetical protein